MPMDINGGADTQGQRLDTAPPRPPRQRQSIMQMAVGPQDTSAAVDMSNPAVKLLQLMGNAKNALTELAAGMPNAAAAIQQFISGLEQVTAQSAADIVSGNPPGSSGSGMGAPGAAQAPSAPPPVQAGTP